MLSMAEREAKSCNWVSEDGWSAVGVSLPEKWL